MNEKRRSCINSDVESVTSESRIKSARSCVKVIKVGKVKDTTKVYRILNGYKGSNVILKELSSKLKKDGIKSLTKEQIKEVLVLGKTEKLATCYGGIYE